MVLSEFIATNRLSMTCKRTDRNPTMEETSAGSMDHWKCTLVRSFEGTALYTNLKTAESKTRTHTARMTLTFSQGYGHHGAEPKLDSVLDCLASDAAGTENAQDFTDWCSEYGYDSDSRKAEKTYKAVQHQAERLKTFLGDELYDALLWHTERE